MFAESRAIGPVVLLLGLLSGPFATGAVAVHVAGEHATAAHGHHAADAGPAPAADHAHGHDHAHDGGHEHGGGSRGASDHGPEHDHASALSASSPARPPVQSPELRPLVPAADPACGSAPAALAFARPLPRAAGAGAFPRQRSFVLLI